MGCDSSPQEPAATGESASSHTLAMCWGRATDPPSREYRLPGTRPDLRDSGGTVWALPKPTVCQALGSHVPHGSTVSPPSAPGSGPFSQIRKQVLREVSDLSQMVQLRGGRAGIGAQNTDCKAVLGPHPGLRSQQQEMPEMADKSHPPSVHCAVCREHPRPRRGACRVTGMGHMMRSSQPAGAIAKCFMHSLSLGPVGFAF